MTSRRMGLAVFAAALSVPTPAFAADSNTAQLVPEWLAIVAGAIGLIIAVMLMVDAVLLRRVAEGSIVADNIAYMMSGVVCLAISVLLRWVAIFISDEAAITQMGWTADLLVTVGMALFTVYFVRIRRSLQRFIDAAAAYSVSMDKPTDDESDDAVNGEGA